jgi:hypothetical protein
MTKAETLMKAINDALASGKSVTFTTYTKAIRVTPKTAKAWAKDGLELFRIENGHVCIAQGKAFVSVMGSKITAS